MSVALALCWPHYPGFGRGPTFRPEASCPLPPNSYGLTGACILRLRFIDNGLRSSLSAETRSNLLPCSFTISGLCLHM